MSTLERIIATPNRSTDYSTWDPARRDSTVRCADGFTVSVITGGGAYSSPRGDTGPYEAVECGFPSARPEPWAEWERFCESPSDPEGTVYAVVPVEMVRALVALHGGEL